MLSERGFAANVLSNVRLMKHNQRHWVDVSTLRRRLGRDTETLSTNKLHYNHTTDPPKLIWEEHVAVPTDYNRMSQIHPQNCPFTSTICCDHRIFCSLMTGSFAGSFCLRPESLRVTTSSLSVHMCTEVLLYMSIVWLGRIAILDVTVAVTLIVLHRHSSCLTIFSYLIL